MIISLVIGWVQREPFAVLLDHLVVLIEFPNDIPQVAVSVAVIGIDSQSLPVNLGGRLPLAEFSEARKAPLRTAPNR